MTTKRCPKCESEGRLLTALSSKSAEYHRCDQCGHVWCYLTADSLKIPREVSVIPPRLPR